jgi:predicted nucleic acid-binding protein
VILKAAEETERLWISRIVWIEVLSRGEGEELALIRHALDGYLIEEVDSEIAERAAALRRERRRLKTPDAIILATAQLHGRTLVTRNTRDFSADMPGILIPYTL